MQPLDDIRVVDLTRVLAGPYCTMMLGDLGAEIIKIEQPGRGDESRQWGPPFRAGESAYFMGINRNKRSVTLNLQQPKARDILRDLVRRSDVVIENFKNGTPEGWGLGYAELSAIQPKLIYCKISGYGPDGPMADVPGYDFIVQAEGGFMSINGPVEGPPMRSAIALVDITTGMLAATAIVSALRVRDRAGIGQRIDLSLLETQMAWLTNVASAYLISGNPPKRYGNSHPSIMPYEVFEAKDGPLALAAANDGLFRKLSEGLHRPELATDPRFGTNPRRVEHADALRAILQAEFGQRGADEWVALLRPLGIPVGRINTVDRALSLPQVLHRHMVVEVEHATAGTIKVVGVPYKFSETPAAIEAAPPTLGQHTDAVLHGLLGLSAEDIARLRQDAVL